MTAPCPGCPERRIGCHGGCRRYREFYKGTDERSKAERKVRMNDTLFKAKGNGI